MKKLILLIVFLLPCFAYGQENMSAARARAALALAHASLSVEAPKQPSLPVLPVPETPTFRKNDYNPKNNTVWREFHPKDGQTWWEDKSLGVIWRYLRPNEDPVTLKVPGQVESGVSQLAQPFRWQQNCPT